MTRDEAEHEAVKREGHKSKHLTNKRWVAQHGSVKGWQVALIDNYAGVPLRAHLLSERPTDAG